MKNNVHISETFLKACAEAKPLYENVLCHYYKELHEQCPNSKCWAYVYFIGNGQVQNHLYLMGLLSKNQDCVDTEKMLNNAYEWRKQND